MPLMNEASVAPRREALAGQPPPSPRAKRAKWALRHVLNTLGYSIARKDR